MSADTYHQFVILRWFVVTLYLYHCYENFNGDSHLTFSFAAVFAAQRNLLGWLLRSQRVWDWVCMSVTLTYCVETPQVMIRQPMPDF